MEINKQPQQTNDEKTADAPKWQFYEISIVCPIELQEFVNQTIEEQATQGKGIFENKTDIPLEDVSEDDFDMVEIYNCKGTFTLYFEELKRYQVMGRSPKDKAFLSPYFKRVLLALLKDSATFIKDNTDKQASTKNHITHVLQGLDKIPIWGLLFQILLLQGLCKWLESVSINEGDNGFNEVQTLYNWLFMALLSKVVAFCYTPYGKKDKERLQPLCDFLYNTQAGKYVQDYLFKGKPDQFNKSPIPPELQTERAVKYFAKAVEMGFLEQTETGYKSKFKSKALLAYFLELVFCRDDEGKDNGEAFPETALNRLFNETRLSKSRGQYINNNKGKPIRYEKVENIFK